MAEVALVTGGAQRIGRAIVERLAAAGFAVAIHHGSNRDEAEALAQRLARGGAKAAVFQADLADVAAAEALLPAAEAALGPVTLLVNNAATFIDDDVRTLDPGIWDQQFAVNLRAPSLLAGAMANRLPAERTGAIVNLIDQRVWKLTPQYYSYTLTKAALLAATTTLAQALAPRIRVNGVGPGPTFANPHDGEQLLAQEAAGTLLGHRIDAREIAEAVLYLARARSVTGQMIAVDAGQHLGWRTPDIVGQDGADGSQAPPSGR
ncbi:SDR family oxidoreductase [Bosea sp. (in: a-proteobacteria)]|uniref:SDR family oxidoreductase n=1 Tax=Bosea sp. (in: a-proteobacteria) TaxID=1871050 RepID=UPI0033426389